MGNGSFWFFFFPFNQVDWDWSFISNRLMFLVGFFSVVYGWRLGWWKENSMVRFFYLKKDRENGWICWRKREIGTEETVCLQFWWTEYGEGIGGGKITSLFFCFFQRVFTLHCLSLFLFLSPCLRSLSLDFVASLFLFMCNL